MAYPCIGMEPHGRSLSPICCTTNFITGLATYLCEVAVSMDYAVDVYLLICVGRQQPTLLVLLSQATNTIDVATGKTGPRGDKWTPDEPVGTQAEPERPFVQPFIGFASPTHHHHRSASSWFRSLKTVAFTMTRLNLLSST